ncbi:MAG: hypothetical protein ACHQ15_05630 [Candidatus Limnocylindrales bacterium]
MTRSPRRLAAIGLAVILIIGVAIGIISSARDALGPGAVTVRGLIGSEKGPFFADAEVIAALRRGGFIVDVSTAGSRQIALADLSHQDFAFPAGVPAAEKIRQDHAGATAFVPFFTPMTIATWKPIVDILIRAGVARVSGNVTTFDVAAYMKLVDVDTRWKDLPGNTTYPVNKSVLITTTDVRKSNSAAMYLALTSYVANGDNIVQNDAGAVAMADRLAPLFLRQGFVASSTEEPFDDYLVQGMGKSPMVMIYESQFIQRAAANDGSITPDMELIYPDPTILSKHTFVGLTANGIRLGDFLTNDPEMRTLATRYGFRTTDTAAFTKFVADHQLSVPASLLDVIDPPTYEAIEAMITRLEAAYQGSGLPSPSTSASP